MLCWVWVTCFESDHFYVMGLQPLSPRPHPLLLTRISPCRPSGSDFPGAVDLGLDWLGDSA